MHIIVFSLCSVKENGVLEHFYVFPCGNPTYLILLVAFTLLYKLVLHAVGLVLAYHTRNIKVNVLNDYHYNTAIIIASSLLFVAVVLFLVNHTSWNGIPWAIMTFLVIYLYLGLTFIPKVCHGKEKLY